MSKLILIRHGETDKNLNNKIHTTEDLEELNETGKIQIQKTAIKLNSIGIDIIYHSTEKRAQQSAEIIANICNLNAIPLKGLEERNWGKYSSKPWSDIKQILDKLTLEERYLYVPEKGESWKLFEERLIKVITFTLDNNKEKNIAIISHGGAIRALIPYLLGTPKETSFQYDPKNASITMFEFNKGTFKSIVIDDTSHLD